jgi:Protein of unknown function (DUF3618)
MSTKNATHREPMSETDTLRIDLEQTRQHLAGTVQELSRRLNVPGRVKESAGHAGQKMEDVPGAMKELPGAMKELPAAMKDLPAISLRHPKATAAVGGAVALGVGAAAWMARRHK